MAKLYLGNPSNPTKTKNTHGRIKLEQGINRVQIPYPSKATFNFPLPGTMHSQMPGVCPGVDVEGSV